MSKDQDVLVLGAGVSGLTTAVTLAEAGIPTRIQASGTGESTTSYAAGATFSPDLHVEWTPRSRRWALATLDELYRLAGDPATGVHPVSGTEAAPGAEEPPDYASHLRDFRMIPPSELPAEFATGWHCTKPIVEMPRYLTYLRTRAEAAGVTVQHHTADRLDLAPVVINCTGIGARTLADDDTLHPVRGQLVVAENPGITDFFLGESDPPVYFFPHGDIVVLGGTAQHDDDDLTPDLALAGTIRDRCAEIDPRLKQARIIGHRVGLRPVRPTIRLEAETVGATHVVHNYGHGGAGISLSWGCATEFLRLLNTP
jgi:D-amino-acid oxidase